MAFDFFVEDEAGNLTQGPMLVHTVATTNSSGAFSVDITGASLTHVHTVHATCLDTASGVTNTTVVSITGFSTSTVAGSVYQFTQNLGILNLAAVGANRTVYITVIGDQA